MHVLKGTIAAAVLALSLSSAVAQTEEEQAVLDAIEAQLPGELMNNFLRVGWNTYGDDQRARLVRSKEAPGGSAYQVEIRKKKDQPYAIAAQGTVQDGVAEGDTVQVYFWARADKLDPDTGTAEVQVRLQQNGAPYTGVAEGTMPLDQEWRLYTFAGTSPASYGEGGIILSFNLGHLKQTVQLGQYYVMNRGQGVDPEALPYGQLN